MKFCDLYLCNQAWYEDDVKLLIDDVPGDAPVCLSPRVANSLYRNRKVAWFYENVVSLLPEVIV